MLKLKYIGDDETYAVEFRTVANNIVELMGDFPIKDTGFTLSRAEHEDNWDYTGYTTVYREIEGGVQFSNDGSVYVEPEQPSEPDTPDYEPYVPTLDEVKESKVKEMNAVQQQTIQHGIDVTLTDGTVEHFSLTDHDQTSLMGLQSQVAAGVEQIPWHTSDESEHCKFYSNADMALITTAAMEYVTWHVTYFRDLRIYIRSFDSADAVNAITYGIEIPQEYQSEPLKAMMAAQTS